MQLPQTESCCRNSCNLDFTPLLPPPLPLWDNSPEGTIWCYLAAVASPTVIVCVRRSPQDNRTSVRLVKVSRGSLFGFKGVTSFQDLLVGQCQQETEAMGKEVSGKDVEVEHRILSQSIKGYEFST